MRPGSRHPPRWPAPSRIGRGHRPRTEREPPDPPPPSYPPRLADCNAGMRTRLVLVLGGPSPKEGRHLRARADRRQVNPARSAPSHRLVALPGRLAPYQRAERPLTGPTELRPKWPPMHVGNASAALTEHNHVQYSGRVAVVLATYRAAQRLALSGVLPSADLLRQRHDGLQRLTALAEEAGVDPSCRHRCDAAVAEIASS